MGRIKTAIRSFTFGAAAGAAAMYYTDPERGRERRQQAAEQAEAAARALSEQTGGTSDDLARRAAGQVAEATRPLHDSGPDTDNALSDRVQTEIKADDRFSHLNIDVVEGDVTVRGTLDSDDARGEMVSRIEGIPGVSSVIDLTHPQGTPAPTR
ncbi:BON domain-containing protein [Euzebya sp.]|uniref:BON domain-containing protein n=1 Tax=Euzebya sp. TaxID=1971409 RepID=UPI003512C7C5